MISLTFCIPSKTEICSKTVGCLFSVLNSELKTEYNMFYNFVIGQSDLPKVRSNTLTKWYFSAKPSDLFFFIDADQTFTINDVKLALQHIKNNDVVGGAYKRGNGTIAVEPLDIVNYFTDLQGPTLYIPTGFMLISYNIVDKLAKSSKLIKISLTEKSYPFFYEKIVTEPEFNNEETWLSEDYSFCHSVRQNNGTIFSFVSDVGHIIPFESKVTIEKPHIFEKNSIVFFCGSTKESWDDRSIDTGIGGSEQAVINLSRYWVKAGYKVYVYCNCENGIYNGVEYINEKLFKPHDVFDILIIWRNIKNSKLSYKARKLYLDLHDLIKDSDIQLNNITKICVKSKYHRSLIDVPQDRIFICPNGGSLEVKETLKDKNYLIYTSSYDRGLKYMLEWGWPKIKRECPNAYLKIFYGWNQYDKDESIEKKKFKEEMTLLMSQDGVYECGRISHEKLIQEKKKASIHYYLGDFQEIDCISVRESASLGAIPIVSSYAEVFREKPYCYCISGDPKEKATQEKCADYIISLLQDENKAITHRKIIGKPQNESWEDVSIKWISEFNL